MAQMLGIGRKDFKIFWSVIRLVAVSMMNNLAGLEITAKNRLHHKPMLGHVAAFGRERMVRAIDIHIVALHPSTPFPFGV